MERKRETIEALGLPAREYNILKKRIGYIDALVSCGEDGLREIDGIGDASIAIIREAMKKSGMDLPAEKTRRVVLFEETSEVDQSIRVTVCKWVPGPEEYTALISEYVGRNMWVIRNKGYSPEGKPVILPPVFDSFEEAVVCAKELLRENESRK